MAEAVAENTKDVRDLLSYSLSGNNSPHPLLIPSQVLKPSPVRKKRCKMRGGGG